MSGTVGETTLSVEQIASHAHTTTLSSNTPGSYNIQPGGGAYYNSSTFPSTNTGGSQTHTHALDSTSGEASSLPPYYALSYIMRTS